MSWCATCVKIALMGGGGALAGVYLDQTYKLPNVEANFKAIKEKLVKTAEEKKK